VGPLELARGRVALSRTGRAVVGATALLVIGFALGSLAGLELRTEHALGILSGAGVLLLLAARNGHEDA